MNRPLTPEREVWDSAWAKEFKLSKEIDYHFSTRKPFYKFLNKSILSLITVRNAINILELGCGTAIDSCVLARNNRVRIFCMDLILPAIQLARRISKEFGVHINFLNCDANGISFKDKSFDLIFSQGVLEHFHNISLVMQEQVRILKNDGILIIDVPQVYTLCTLFKHWRIKKGTWPYGWETQFSYRDLINLGNRYGLEAIDVCGHEYDSYARFFNLSLFRNIIKRFQDANPMRNNLFFKKIESCYDEFWGILEKKYGHYFLVNIAVAFKKR